MTYLSRENLITALGTFAERDYEMPGVGVVRIRELSAAQRIEASQAARAGTTFDAALFNAIVAQQGVIEPALTKADVAALAAGRAGVVESLANAIWALSEATPEAFQGGDPPADDGE